MAEPRSTEIPSGFRSIHAARRGRYGALNKVEREHIGAFAKRAISWIIEKDERGLTALLPLHNSGFGKQGPLALRRGVPVEVETAQLLASRGGWPR